MEEEVKQEIICASSNCGKMAVISGIFKNPYNPALEPKRCWYCPTCTYKMRYMEMFFTPDDDEAFERVADEVEARLFNEHPELRP